MHGMNERLRPTWRRGRILGGVLLLILISATLGLCSQDGEPVFEKRAAVFDRFSGITVACPMGAPPFSFLESDGEVKGAVIDLWRLWSQKTGISVRFKSGPWGQTVADVCSGIADVHADFDEPDHPCLELVTPTADFSQNIFWHKNITGVRSIDDLDGIQIGIVEDTVEHQHVLQHYPSARIAPYSSIPEIVEAARKGEIKAFVSIEESLIWRLKEIDILTDFRFNPKQYLFRNIAYAAVKRGDDALADEVREGMARISPAERSAIERKWLDRYSLKADDTLMIVSPIGFPPLMHINTQGEPAGMFIDIWRLWAEKMDCSIEFLTADTWQSSLNSLWSGMADIHGGLFAVPERYSWIKFSQHLHETGVTLHFPIRHGRYERIEDLYGKPVGAVRGTVQEQYLKNSHPEIRVIPFDRREEMVNAARNGNIEAFISARVMVDFDLSHLGLSGEFESLPETLYTGAFSAGVLAERPELLKMVDEGFNRISNKELIEIEARWIPDPKQRFFTTPSGRIRLTAAESAWLNAHPKIDAGMHTDLPPVVFWEEDRFKGIDVDFYNLISRITGIEWNFIPVRRGSTLKAFKSGEFDLQIGFKVRSDFMKLHGVIPTEPFIPFKLVILSRSDAPFIVSFDSLQGKTVASLKDTPVFNHIYSDVEGVRIRSFSSLEDAFAAISKGEVDAMVYAMQLVSHPILMYPNLKIAGIPEYPPIPYVFWVRESLPELMSILNKAIGAITKEERDAIIQKWFTIQIQHKADWSGIVKSLLIIGSIFALILALSFYWNRKLLNEVTERKRTEESLNEIRKRLEESQRIARMGQWELDILTNTLYWSDEIYNLFEIAPARFGASYEAFLDAVHPDDRAMVNRAYTESVSTKKPYEIIHRLLMKDGRVKYVREICRTEYGADETPLRSVGIVQDITEIKKAEESKSRFLANMSHEIRTPMNSVLGFLDLTLEDPNLPDSHRTRLTIAHRSAKDLLRLLNDILDMSRLEQGRLELAERSFDLAEIIHSSLSVVEWDAREKGLAISVEIHPDLPSCFTGDPERLKQILVNLAGNAVKFTHEGSIGIRVAPGSEEDILYFAVADTGIGISPDQLKIIFDPFAQADSSISRSYGGTGLGTTISRQLVQRMGGRIWTESEPGKGSLFHFTVRMKPAPERPDDPAPIPHQGKTAWGRPYTLLLAEDMEENIILAKLRLSARGHRVLIAVNGEEAIEMMKKHPEIDAVLMDIHMPVMDGLTATRRIREMERGRARRVPIIALTASMMKSEQKDFRKAGMDAVVGKPIQFDILFDTLEKCISGNIEDRLATEASASAPGSAAAPGPGIAGVDFKRGIARWQNEAAYLKALHSVADTYADGSDRILRHIERGEIKEAIQIAHGLKGISGNLCIFDVYDLSSKLNAALLQERIEAAKALIPPLRKAFGRFADSLETQGKKSEKSPEVLPDILPDMVHDRVRELLRQMMGAFDQYNPRGAAPFLKELADYLSEDRIEPIKNQMERFDMDKCRARTRGLAADLGIDL